MWIDHYGDVVNVRFAAKRLESGAAEERWGLADMSRRWVVGKRCIPAAGYRDSSHTSSVSRDGLTVIVLTTIDDVDLPSVVEGIARLCVPRGGK